MIMNSIISRKDVHAQLEKIGSAEILVGIPSFNNARTIGHVVRAAQAGLAKYFPDRKAILVNSDGGSTDSTVDVVKNTRIEDQSCILLYHRCDRVATISTPYP